jgi:hypothetical protein
MDMYDNIHETNRNSREIVKKLKKIEKKLKENE